MLLKFYGADKEVTGSCHYVEANGKRLLIDCGLLQGHDVNKEEQDGFPFDPASIDYVLVTHGHIDHTGRLPLLVKLGFRGAIYATGKTCELMRVMLADSAHIQEMDAEWKQRKHRRSGDELEEPLYTVQDAQDAFGYFHSCEYGEVLEISQGIAARYIDAGHLLGSASIELTIREGEETRTIVFSGDIGNPEQPMIRGPQYFHRADYVVMESTYGDRLHEKPDDLVKDLAQIIDSTLSRGGNVVIPAFAVGRTQELLYYIREIKERFLVKSVPQFPVYVDSPLALEATRIYDNDLTGYADEETVELLRQGFRPLDFAGQHLCRSAQESIALNADETPKVIISSSGMCDAGRIRHHLKHNLWRPECSIVFVGYQANGTLGRMLLNGVKDVKLFGESIAVKAQIHNYRSMSGHGDRNELLHWISQFKGPVQKVFVVHGEEDAAENFAETLRNLGHEVFVPDYKAEYDLIGNQCIFAGVAHEALDGEVHEKASPDYERLVALGSRIQEMISHSQGRPVKDIRKLADQLHGLVDKWDR